MSAHNKQSDSASAPPTSTLTFPVQLHHVLNVLEHDGQSHIASWQPHGRSFRIHNRVAFIETVLPRWFRLTKFSSFQRQLNLYEFVRVSSGPDRNSHYHELFVRDRPMLALKMYRVKVKGSGPRRPLSIVKVPDMTPLSKNHVTHYTAFPILAANTGGMVSIYNSGASTMQSTSSGGQPTDTSPLTFRLASSETTVIVPTNDAGDGPGIAWLFQCLHYQEQMQKEKRRRKKLGQLMRHLVHRHAQDRERCQQLENLVTQLLLAPRPSGVVGFGGETNQAQALAPIFYAAQLDSETH